jgi:cytochrome b
MKIDVWSRTIRLFHIFFVISITVLFFSEDFEELHEIVGYIALFLVLFRFWHGFSTKNQYAKNSEFFHSPKKIFSFLKSVMIFKEERYLGHNPMAGLVMFLILITTIISAISGAVGFAMKEEEGFAVALIEPNFELGKEILAVHTYSTDFLLVLIGLHLMGVLVSSVMTKENLAKSIFIDGKKRR